MKSFVLLFVLLCGFEVSYAQSPRTSWPMINGDPTRTSYANINMDFPLYIADTLQVHYRQENGMALWENKLYLADYALDSNRLVVTNIITGDSLWSFDVPGSGGGMEFIPAVSEGIVMIGGQGGKGLYGLDALTGDSLWFLPVGSLYTRSPVITDSMVYLSARDSLICFNLHSGDIYWSNTGVTRQVVPVVDEQKVYACGDDAFLFLFAVDKFTGDTLWRNDSIRVGNFLSLSADSQYLYTGYLTTISALDKATGEVDWSVELDTNQILVEFPGAFALTKDYLVVKYLENGQDKNQFLILNKSTGQEINRYTGTSMTYSSPTVINDYVADFYGRNLFMYDLVSGDEVFSMTDIPVSNYTSQIIAANDKIIIAGGGDFVAVLEGNTTAVPEAEHELVSFLVYPNPTHDQLNLLLSLDHSSELLLEVFTAAGVLVNTHVLGKYPRGEHRLSLPVSGLEPGLYFLHLRSMEGDTVRKVLIMD